MVIFIPWDRILYNWPKKQTNLNPIWTLSEPLNVSELLISPFHRLFRVMSLVQTSSSCTVKSDQTSKEFLIFSLF